MTTTAFRAGHTRTEAPLDSLLVDAALGPTRHLVPDRSTARWALSLARRPRSTARRLSSLGAEVARIAIGTSTVRPNRADRRFSDTAWTGNPSGGPSG